MNIYDELMFRWATAEDGDAFLADVRRFVVGFSKSPLAMKALMTELEAADPDVYREIVSGTTLPARLRGQAWDLGKFLADKELSGCTQEDWCLDHGIEIKRLQRALKRYREDSAFRAETDHRAEIWKRTLSGKVSLND